MTTQHIYNDLKAAGIPLDNHESDLYAKVTPESREIVNAYYHRYYHRGDVRTVGTFKSEIDGDLWYELPFCYLPWWEAREARKASKEAARAKLIAAAPELVECLRSIMQAVIVNDQNKPVIELHVGSPEIKKARALLQRIEE